MPVWEVCTYCCPFRLSHTLPLLVLFLLGPWLIIPPALAGPVPTSLDLPTPSDDHTTVVALSSAPAAARASVADLGKPPNSLISPSEAGIARRAFGHVSRRALALSQPHLTPGFLFLSTMDLEEIEIKFGRGARRAKRRGQLLERRFLTPGKYRPSRRHIFKRDMPDDLEGSRLNFDTRSLAKYLSDFFKRLSRRTRDDREAKIRKNFEGELTSGTESSFSSPSQVNRADAALNQNHPENSPHRIRSKRTNQSPLENVGISLHKKTTVSKHETVDRKDSIAEHTTKSFQEDIRGEINSETQQLHPESQTYTTMDKTVFKIITLTDPHNNEGYPLKEDSTSLIQNDGHLRAKSNSPRASGRGRRALRGLDPTESDLRGSLGAHLQARRRGGSSQHRRYPLIKLIRGPWLLAVSTNGTVYTTIDVNDANTIFVSRSIDNRLVTLEGREARRFLTFSKKGHLTTSKRMNRRTHFIASTSADHYLSYLSKHKFKQYWYIGVTDSGRLTTYSKVIPEEAKVSSQEAKVSSGETKVNSGKNKVTTHAKVTTAQSKVIGNTKVTTEQSKVTSAHIKVTRGHKRHRQKQNKRGKSHTTPEIVQYSLVENADSMSGDMSVSAFDFASKPSTTPAIVAVKQDTTSSLVETGRRRHHKKTSKRRRRRRKCRTQRCACLRSKSLAPWCRFHILPVDRQSDGHYT